MNNPKGQLVFLNLKSNIKKEKHIIVSIINNGINLIDALHEIKNIEQDNINDDKENNIKNKRNARKNIDDIQWSKNLNKDGHYFVKIDKEKTYDNKDHHYRFIPMNFTYKNEKIAYNWKPHIQI